MRYNRNDYAACDWKASKSDILRSKQKTSRTLPAAKIMAAVIAIAVSGLAIWEMIP